MNTSYLAARRRHRLVPLLLAMAVSQAYAADLTITGTPAASGTVGANGTLTQYTLANSDASNRLVLVGGSGGNSLVGGAQWGGFMGGAGSDAAGSVTSGPLTGAASAISQVVGGVGGSSVNGGYGGGWGGVVTSNAKATAAGAAGSTANAVATGGAGGSGTGTGVGGKGGYVNRRTLCPPVARRRPRLMEPAAVVVRGWMARAAALAATRYWPMRPAASPAAP